MSIKDGPGEGTWSVFAQKVVEQRDEAREEAARLTDEIKRLRAALDAVMDACDPECYGCGAYYVAKKALAGKGTP